jgi:hypothetical protein
MVCSPSIRHINKSPAITPHSFISKDTSAFELQDPLISKSVQTLSNNQITDPTNPITMPTPSTCCRKSGQGCVWYGTFFTSRSCSKANKVSAQRKPNAPVARNPLCTAPVAEQRLRTPSLDPAAHAVCYPLHSFLSSIRSLFLHFIELC